MTNVELLKEKIKQSGKKRAHLANVLGVSRAGFYNLCSGKTQFRTEQVKVLCQELGITDAEEMASIFFA